MTNLPKIKLAQKPTYKKLANNVDFFKLFEKMDRGKLKRQLERRYE